MATPFPNHPSLRDGFAPIQMECDAPDLVVVGDVPKQLNGTFFRNGANPDHADARRVVADVRQRQQAHRAQLTRGF